MAGEAYNVALAHTMKVEASNASTEVMYILSTRLARHEEARGWAEHAEPLSRAAETSQARAWYLNDLGVVVAMQGEHEQAGDFIAGASPRSHTVALATPPPSPAPGARARTRARSSHRR